MDNLNSSPHIAARTSRSIKLYDGPQSFKELCTFSREQTKNYRVMQYSHSGNYFAYCDGISVRLIESSTNKIMAEMPKPKTALIEFSPLDSYLVTWEQYAANSTDSMNVTVFNVSNGSVVHSFIQKKPCSPLIEWSDDECVAAVKMNNEVHFYEKNDFNVIAKKLHMPKMTDFSLSPGTSPYHVSCYVTGSKGQPSFVRLFKYPNFEGPSAAVANKSFFKADSISFYWNLNGTGLLVLTSTDVDKSGASYYGEQTLHYLATDGESCIVQLEKKGPIYSLEWSPSSTNFSVCYGFMPAKVTVYNLKCNPVFDFGTGPRNALTYNIHGNLLLIYGFGNLRGNVEIWDMNKHKLIKQTQAPDSTHLEWSPDGIHFMTCTTAPRLQVGNGYKIWHYSGSLLHEYKCPDEEKIYEMKWQNKTRGTFKQQDISYKAVAGLKPSQPEASKQVYVPPSARNNPHNIPKIKEQYEPPSNARQNSDNLSKNALKNRKKKEAKKAKKNENSSENSNFNEDVSGLKSVQPNVTSGCEDPDIEKKIRNLRKKLDAINKLKNQQKAGKTLEKNQIEKIKKEQELIEELENLSIQ